jgi:DNA modification methylase
MITENILIESGLSKNASNAVDYHSLPRFRWYGYKEGFSPNLVEGAMEEVGMGQDDYILDPFNGNGTVTLTASINDIKSVGIEVNPFVAFMSQTKLENFSAKAFLEDMDKVLALTYEGKPSCLCSFSTFSEQTGKNKWLFNSDVLNSVEGGWQSLKNFPDAKKKIFQLSLIGAAMDNCNAVKDGKCLKYRSNWQNRNFNKDSYISSLQDRLQKNHEDLGKSLIPQKALIINGDARCAIQSIPGQYKLCITSPPYLNSFDYTDIYRPELFLGKFIQTARELKQLRFNTIRSHVEITLPKPTNSDFGEVYYSVHQKISNSENNWSKQIPIMIQSYFEDMQQVLSDLLMKAKREGELWLIVANSVYVGTEIPVDLILAEIGTRNGWKLKRIEVLRYIYRRKTKYCGDIDKVRESLIVFKKV